MDRGRGDTAMSTANLEERLATLKADYMKYQGDLEKVESTGGDGGPIERQLCQLEEEIQKIREEIRSNG